ncbi:DUF1491 family protein [Rhizorhapis sp. SPR117]|uniref:DUF1491 family protein n=1 Tax=Rhizorhapis sp. SPR117 TaxID=2912611 RepID=UPI0030C7D4D9
MSDRLTSRMLASALIRRAGQEGGFATIVRKGDEVAGTILLICLERGIETGLFERIPDYAGGYRLVPCGPTGSESQTERTQYIERRTKSDPDIWLIELNIPQPERFAAETIC